MRAVVFTGVGGPEVMELQERPEPQPGTGEAVVAVTHAGLNPADLLQRLGRHAVPPGVPSDIPGLEVAGRVVACGPSAGRWAVGDRVFGIVGGGGLAERVVVHERHLAAVPASLDDAGAAAVPEAFVTAHDAVFTVGRLALGEILLVNGANGGVGTAAVQLGVAAGAEVLVSVRSDDAAERLAGMGAVRDDGERPVDVVLELVGAPNVEADVARLRRLGRVIIVGTGAGADAAVSLRALMACRGAVHGTSLRGRSLEDKAFAVDRFAAATLPHLASGRIEPVIDRVFPVAALHEAYEHLAEPGKFGKVLIAFD
jgi:NADPH:quinone reductase-like Zn-dependent oxidoreductase